jgi:hypothetical protein
MTFFEQIFPGVRLHEWPDPVTGVVYFAPREACAILGLDWSAHQRERLCFEPYECRTIPGGVLTGGMETVLLGLGSLPFWLMQVSDAEVSPALRAPLIAYQRACMRVLYEQYGCDMLH